MTDTNKFLATDDGFDELFPPDIQRCTKRHWTPVDVVALSIDFLAKDGGKILDIGSGVGKFCLAGAYKCPQAHFYGVEQRANLISHATEAQKKLGITNATFINGNF